VAPAYLVTCWNCLGEFDALGAVWCSDDPKSPTKLCPFCLHCFCDSSAAYKQQFWRHAPPLRGLVRTGVTTFEELARLRL